MRYHKLKAQKAGEAGKKKVVLRVCKKRPELWDAILTHLADIGVDPIDLKEEVSAEGQLAQPVDDEVQAPRPMIDGAPVEDHPNDIPRSTTRLRGVSADTIRDAIAEVEAASCSVHALQVFVPKGKRAIVKQHVLDLFEYMTGWQPDLYLGTVGPLKYFNFLVYEARRRNLARGRRARDLVLRFNMDYTAPGIGIYGVWKGRDGTWWMTARGCKQPKKLPHRVVAKLLPRGKGEIFIEDNFSESRAKFCGSMTTEYETCEKCFPDLIFGGGDDDCDAGAGRSGGSASALQDPPELVPVKAGSRRRNDEAPLHLQPSLSRRRIRLKKAQAAVPKSLASAGVKTLSLTDDVTDKADAVEPTEDLDQVGQQLALGTDGECELDETTAPSKRGHNVRRKRRVRRALVDAAAIGPEASAVSVDVSPNKQVEPRQEELAESVGAVLAGKDATLLASEHVLPGGDSSGAGVSSLAMASAVPRASGDTRPSSSAKAGACAGVASIVRRGARPRTAAMMALAPAPADGGAGGVMTAPGPRRKELSVVPPPRPAQ